MNCAKGECYMTKRKYTPPKIKVVDFAVTDNILSSAEHSGSQLDDKEVPSENIEVGGLV